MKALKLGLLGLGAFAGAALLGTVVVTSVELRRAARELLVLTETVDSMRGQIAGKAPALAQGMLRTSVATSFSNGPIKPTVDSSAFIDPQANVLGAVVLGPEVYVAPFASIRGDEGQPIYVGPESNVQDGAVIHALETATHGQPVPGRTYRVDDKEYAVYIGTRVSLAHQSLVHRPARIDDRVFVGMQAMVFSASVGAGSVIEPGAKVIGVDIPAGRHVPAGMTVTSQDAADRLPTITADYAFRGLNDGVVHVNTSFARACGAAARPPAEGFQPASAQTAAQTASAAGGH